jgi:hypothetical protein
MVGALCSQWIACSPGRNGGGGRPLNSVVRSHAMRTSIIIAMGIIVVPPGAAHAAATDVVDHGITSTPRYTVDLGPLDLTHRGNYTYQLRGLPSVEFTIGVQLDEPVTIQHLSERVAPTARIKLVVVSEQGRTVISEGGELAQWTLSFGRDEPQSFLYRHGAESEQPQSNGAVRLVRVDAKADRGWGTYFTPRRGATYSAVVEVIDPMSDQDRRAHLVLRGGGWK